MSVFVPRWTQWQPEPDADSQASSRTSKTSRTQFSPTAGATEDQTNPDTGCQSCEEKSTKEGKTFPGAASDTPCIDSEIPSSSKTSKTCKTLEPEEKPATSGQAERSEEIASMPLEAFAQAGLIVTVWSDVLNREVLFVSDNVPDEALEGRDLVVYRAADLANLAQARPTPGALRFIHEVKAVFGGTIRTTTIDQEAAS